MHVHVAALVQERRGAGLKMTLPVPIAVEPVGPTSCAPFRCAAGIFELVGAHERRALAEDDRDVEVAVAVRHDQEERPPA